MENSTNKKTLIITGQNEKLHHLFPVITNKKAEELIIINSFGNAISQPYDSSIRSILIAVYYENVEEVYIIEEKDSEECSITEDEFLSKIQEAGISREVTEAIEYIGVVGDNLMSWLVGKQDMQTIVKENINWIKNHPLIPKNVSVYGFIANAETSEFEAIS